MECIVRGCRYSYGRPRDINNNILMYKFPTERDLRRLWLKALNINEYELKAHWFVCENHFSIYDYNTDGTLKYNAIPWLDIYNYSGDPMDVDELEMGLEKQVDMPTREKVHSTQSETDFTNDIKIEDVTMMQKEIEVIVTVGMEQKASVRERKIRIREEKFLKAKQKLKELLPDKNKMKQDMKPSTSTNYSVEPRKNSKLTKESAKITNNTREKSKRIKKVVDHYVITNFAKYVQSRLKSIKNDDIRQKAQKKIMEVLIKYAEKDIAESTY